MTDLVTLDDLPASIQTHESVGLWLDGANAKASRVAPCLTWDGEDDDEDHPAPSADQLAEARLVLVGAISRWAEAGSGALQSQTAGPFGVTVDTRQRSNGYNLWPSEINQLQEICVTATATSGAFSLDTAPPLCGLHLDVCALNLGATYCSCGVDIAGYPIFEGADTDAY